jgi:hypothetical protein
MKASGENSNTYFLYSDASPQKNLTLVRGSVKKSREYSGEKTRNKKNED